MCFILLPKKENVTLIKEVNDLRKELKISRSRNQDLETALGISRKNAATTTEAIVQALHVHQGKKFLYFNHIKSNFFN